MRKRDSVEYITSAEEQIDSGWRNLAIFKSPRPAALLKLTTATDHRIRLGLIAGASPEKLFSRGYRFAQDALDVAIPWIFKECPVVGEPIPLSLDEADYKQGAELAEYAEAYDAAVIAFTNYHLGRFQAFVARRDPRITFTYSSPEIERIEVAKRAYEMYELAAAISPRLVSAEALKPIQELKELVERTAIREDGDRIRLDIDAELLSGLRSVEQFERLLHPTDLDESFRFNGIPYGNYRRYLFALAAIGQAHLFSHLGAAARGVPGGAISSLTMRFRLTDLNQLVAQILGLPTQTVQSVSELLVYDGSLKIPAICQPLMRANENEVIVPYAFVMGSRFERNLEKLLARHPSTGLEYSRLSSSKEGIAIPRLVALLQKKGFVVRDRVTISQSEQVVTEVKSQSSCKREKRWASSPLVHATASSAPAELVARSA
jgi:hypothetical protein